MVQGLRKCKTPLHRLPFRLFGNCGKKSSYLSLFLYAIIKDRLFPLFNTIETITAGVKNC